MSKLQKMLIGFGFFVMFFILVFFVVPHLQPGSAPWNGLGLIAAIAFYACGFFHFAAKRLTD